MANPEFEKVKEDIELLKEQQLSDRADIDSNTESVVQVRALVLKKDSGDELPPHTHKVDQIQMKDLRGGLIILTATPTHVQENGKPLFYTVGGTSYLAVKIGKTWKKVALSDV